MHILADQRMVKESLHLELSHDNAVGEIPFVGEHICQTPVGLCLPPVVDTTSEVNIPCSECPELADYTLSSLNVSCILLRVFQICC